jgi:hypothetical protein
MLAKSPAYFCDGEAVKTAAAPVTVQRDLSTRVLDDPDEQFAVRHDHETLCLSGANARDVQTWAAECLREHYCPACQWLGTFGATARRRPEPLRRRCPKCKAKVISHYAAFPTALVHFCLAAACSSRGYCPGCGAPWCRVLATPSTAEVIATDQRPRLKTKLNYPRCGGELRDVRGPGTTTLGWRPTCACCPPAHADGVYDPVAPEFAPRPARVLDPFAGSGRVGIQAQRMGLDFVGIELSPAYAGMARRLLRDAAPLFYEEG